MATSTKKSKGRQKVEMVRMVKDSNRQVTFSKRRTGLFKKASELCTLCGVEAAIIVFSPGKKAFSFGHPSVDMIVNRFLLSSSSIAPSSSGGRERLDEARHNTTICKLNMELTRTSNRMENEKQRSEELNEIAKARRENHWWDAPTEELMLQHLVRLKSSLDELRKQVMHHGNKLAVEGRITGPPFMEIDHCMVGLDGALYNPNRGLGYGQSHYQP